jgi:phosphocarrier protein
MVQAEVTVTLLNKVGLHARPAALFVQTSNKFKSRITVKKGEKEVDAKSILGVLSLGAEFGSIITIKANGDDAYEAVKTLFELVKNKFYEE